MKGGPVYFGQKDNSVVPPLTKLSVSKWIGIHSPSKKRRFVLLLGFQNEKGR